MRRYRKFAFLLCLLQLSCTDSKPVPQPAATPPTLTTPTPPPPIRTEPTIVEQPTVKPEPAPVEPVPPQITEKPRVIVGLPKARVTSGRVLRERAVADGQSQDTTVVEATIQLDGEFPENSFYAVLLKNRSGGGIYIDLVGQQDTYEFRHVFVDGFNQRAFPITLTVVGRIPPTLAWAPLGAAFQITKAEK